MASAENRTIPKMIRRPNYLTVSFCSFEPTSCDSSAHSLDINWTVHKARRKDPIGTKAD